MTPQDDAIKIRILINDKARGQYLVLVLFLHVHGRPEELRGIGVHGALHELDMAGHFGGFSDGLRNGAWTSKESMKISTDKNCPLQHVVSGSNKTIPLKIGPQLKESKPQNIYMQWISRS